VVAEDLHQENSPIGVYKIDADKHEIESYVGVPIQGYPTIMMAVEDKGHANPRVFEYVGVRRAADIEEFANDVLKNYPEDEEYVSSLVASDMIEFVAVEEANYDCYDIDHAADDPIAYSDFVDSMGMDL